MAEEYTTSGSWWESPRNRFESGTPSSTSSGLTSIGSFGWLTDMTTTDMKSLRSSSSINHSPVSNSMVFLETHHPKLNLGEASGCGGGGGGGSSGSTLGAETNLHMMNLGLSSQTMDWNRPMLRGGDKASDQGSFRSMLQQDNVRSNTSFPQEDSGGGSSQVQWRSSPKNLMIQAVGILGSENQQQNQHSGFENNYNSNSSYQPNYGLNNSDNDQILAPNWSKVPQFMRGSPQKPPQTTALSGQLQFSNNEPFWNASTAAAPPTVDVRPSFFSPVQAHFSSPNFEEKPNKNLLEASTNPSTAVVPKKSGSQVTHKRPRNEAQSPVPAFKVRKEKMGDRITALQQLVSPFGKTDTASVLTEAIDYIKLLHEKVHELSIPYMKSGVAMHHHRQNYEKSNEGPKQDLRSRGLCLIPLSSTYQVTAHETNFDFWNPTLGGTFR